MENMENLFVLPFDHRASMLRELGIRDKARLPRLKRIIFKGFKLALARGVPRASTAVLVDAEFGARILREAKRLRVKTAMPIEKSETPVFEFEPNFEKIVEKFDPDFVKALVRFNPAPELEEKNAVQLARLKHLNDFLKKTRREFLLELLVPPTQAQLKKLGRKAFNSRLRPALALQAMKTIQGYGINPSVWKVEGFNASAQARALARQARAGGRTARVIILGRGESEEKIKKWLAVGARTRGVIGFAVGRTVFVKPLRGLLAGRTSERSAVEAIAENFKRLADFWIDCRKSLKH